MPKFLIKLERKAIDLETLHLEVEASSEVAARHMVRAHAYDSDAWYHAKTEPLDTTRSVIVEVTRA